MSKFQRHLGFHVGADLLDDRQGGGLLHFFNQLIQSLVRHQLGEVLCRGRPPAGASD
ncbi:MAG: hypothetical protein R3E50_14190 [Halioglobus sp.]